MDQRSTRVTSEGRVFCKGKFWFGNIDRPSDDDLDNAKKFAKEMIN